MVVSELVDLEERMKIVILGLNYAPEKVGIAVYTAGLAEELVKMGHEVRVVAGQPYYPTWRPFDKHAKYRFTRSKENGVDVTRCPHYIPKYPSGVKRVLHHLSFAVTAFFPMLLAAVMFRPDIVFCVAPSIVAAPVGRLAAVVGRSKTWLHIQDFEVEAAFATGLLPDTGWLARSAQRFERKVLLSFAKVSTISEKMCQKLLQKGVPQERVYEFRNWANPDLRHRPASDSIYRQEWNILTKHVALYSGNIANKQGIEIIVEAASILKDLDLTFIICGEGTNRAELQSLAGNLPNVRFYNLQPRERLGELLSLATVHLVPQLASATDLVLPSKISNILASGRPLVVTAQPESGIAREVEDCGIITDPGDPIAFAAGIQALLEDNELMARLSAAALVRASERWSASVILTGVERAMRELEEGAPARNQPHSHTLRPQD